MNSQVAKVVLVVDDNADVCASLARLLGLFGFAVDTASDGQSALDYLHSHAAPCLIVLDLRMPRMDGLQFLAAREKSNAISKIPVIVCSGEPEWAVHEQLGDIAYFTKGTNPMQLIQFVLQMCA
jgi:CheY-like chemotaxis protein